MILSDMQKYRFWSKVNKTCSCWLWTAGCDSDGYGGVSLNGKSCKAHRISWLLTYGEIPKLDVLHECDTPACVNPEHLFLGTSQDNVIDAIRKGRRPEGEAHTSAKVKDADIQTIRFKVSIGIPMIIVGNEFGLSATQICRICNGQSRRNS